MGAVVLLLTLGANRVHPHPDVMHRISEETLGKFRAVLRRRRCFLREAPATRTIEPGRRPSSARSVYGLHNTPQRAQRSKNGLAEPLTGTDGTVRRVAL